VIGIVSCAAKELDAFVEVAGGEDERLASGAAGALGGDAGRGGAAG